VIRIAPIRSYSYLESITCFIKHHNLSMFLVANQIVCNKDADTCKRSSIFGTTICTIFFSMREEFFLVLQKLQTLLFSRLTIIEHLKPRYSIWLDIWVFRSRWTDNELGYEYMIEVFDRATAARTNTDLIQLSFARSKINSVYFKHAAGAEAAKKLLSRGI